MLDKSGDEENKEPKENEQCIPDKGVEMNSKNSRLDELRGRAKKLASNKYHLIIVLLCIILFILFLIVIILAVQLGTYTCPESNECRTAECLSAASTVVMRSSNSVDPCDDFWSYSCNGWISRNPLPINRGSYSVKEQLKEEIYRRIRHVIDLVPHNIDTSKHQWKVKNFYDTCLNLNQIGYWVPDKIKKSIHDIGGWAIINDVPSGQWDRNSALIKLHVTFGVEAFFKILVEPDDENPIENIIKLVPGGLGMPNRHYYFHKDLHTTEDVFAKTYKDFIRNTVQEMGVGLSESTKFAEEVYNYERRLAEVTPSPEALRNTKDLYVKLTVTDLDRRSASISWQDLLQTYFPGVIHPDTEVAIISEEYFRDISRIISSTDNSVLNNYYMWRLMHTFAQHSSSKFRLVDNYFKQTFEGVSDLNLNYKEIWESCIDITSQFLGHAIGSMYVSHYYPQESQEKVSIYLHKLAGALSAITRDIPWLDAEDQEAAQYKIRTIHMMSGHPSFAKNQSMDTYYMELRVQTDYFQNIKDGVNFRQQKQKEMLKNKAMPDYSWTIYPHDVIADYKYSGNQLVVPAGLFEDPLFNFGAPLAVKYGILAAHVANKLGEVFDDKGINYNEYGTLKAWIANHTIASFKEKKNCLKSAISNYSLHGVKVEPELTVGSLIADIGGVKLAYEAYRRHSEEENENFELPGTNINNKQLFFISYAQSLCQTIRPEKLKFSRNADIQLPEELRVLGTLQQLPEFSNAFSCGHGSKMHSERRCDLW